MFEKIKHCPVCDSALLDQAYIVKDHMVTEESFAISRCRTCSFLFTNPRPIESELGKYYDSERYLSHNKKTTSLFAGIYNLARTRALKQKLAWLERYTSKGKLLDYGCGVGLFMQFAQSRGWQSYGMEPNESARKQAQENHANLVWKSLEEIEKKKFDAITLFHVLEHIPDLNKTLKGLRKKLQKEGIMLVALPNTDAPDAEQYREYWAAWDVPRHLYHFNSYTATLLFKKHKFSVIDTIPMQMDAYYVSLLSEQYQKGQSAPNLSTYWQAFWSGRRSNRLAKRNNGNYSSLVYVLKKK
jgi:2-polyprenyl-3-methyl-5-hydroxy-6-metoxy-1,4-benzoquinol methylase